MKNITITSTVSDSIHNVEGQRSCFNTDLTVTDYAGNEVTVPLSRKELKRLIKAAKAQLKSI